ncbi:colicin-like pore-forming protein [Erwinia pyrifoliae]|uniref:Colicin-like pore-forming protein n=1 Tax=Erwinia pyrifoliae TaxID=79967 RepID=A0ABY5XAS8_ERWPY|nr:colicin-like pore-forming protein [Erwinia pyrifoliae]MCT2386494.1 colicin-like pore-forming protein [Erwinia pyrifoliae]MCU8587909.1 colicin-like pore-forming protein [Erwinia pyrifoliae]UWS34496.1 colicin-like pore-forming protein [Erwinia pyrifoliae]
MATLAYYRDGIPYGTDGHVIITITGDPVGAGSLIGSNTARPVYVGWPGMGSQMSHGTGPVAHYDSNKLGHHSLTSIREGQAQINQLMTKARSAYHQNGEQIVRESTDLLDSLRKSGLIHHAELNTAVAALEEALKALQANMALKNNAEQDVSAKTQATTTAFEQFIARDDVKMHNFKDARPFVFDFVLSISPIYHHIIELWNRFYLPKLQQEMEEKNNLVTYLDRVKIICDDVINKTKHLNNEKIRIEKKEQVIKELEEHKNRPTPIADAKNPLTDVAIKPLMPEPVVIKPVIVEPVVIEPPLTPFITIIPDLALQKPTALIPFVPIKTTPLRPPPVHPLIPFKPLAEEDKDNDETISAVKFTADFYKELTEKWGGKSAEIAQELAWDVKGKQIRNADEALDSFEKYKDVLSKKFSLKDREAISKALESLTQAEIAKNFVRFSKGLGLVSSGIDVYETAMEFKKAIDSHNWRPFYVKLETLLAGKGASALTAFAYSLILATPIGILGFAFIMTLVGVFVDEKFVEKINRALGI